MKGDKVFLILIIGVIGIILFDAYTKYAEKKRQSDLEAQRVAQQKLLQMQIIEKSQTGDQRGFLGNFLSNIPLIGGLY